MSFEVKIIRNTISPELARLIRACKNPKSVLGAMGLAGVSLTKRAFNDASLRPLPWPPLKNASPKGKRAKSTGRFVKTGAHAPLKKSGALWQSPRITEIGTNFVKFGTDRPYAKYHQFGTKHIPARPFFPFDASGKMTPTALQKVEAAARKALSKLLKK